MKCAVAQIAVFVALAAVAASSPARTLSSGVITVGHGVKGAELGMNRPQVVRKLGRPNMENGFGTMSYGSDRSNTIFDVYRTRAGASGTC